MCIPSLIKSFQNQFSSNMGIKDTNSTALSWSCWGMRPGLLLHMSDDHSQRQHYPTVYIVYIYHKLTYDLIFWLSIILMLLHRYYTTMYYIFWLLSRQLKLFSNCTSIIPAECTFLGGFTTILLTVEQWTQLGNCDRGASVLFVDQGQDYFTNYSLNLLY